MLLLFFFSFLFPFCFSFEFGSSDTLKGSWSSSSCFPVHRVSNDSSIHLWKETTQERQIHFEFTNWMSPLTHLLCNYTKTRSTNTFVGFEEKSHFSMLGIGSDESDFFFFECLDLNSSTTPHSAQFALEKKKIWTGMRVYHGFIFNFPIDDAKCAVFFHNHTIYPLEEMHITGNSFSNCSLLKFFGDVSIKNFKQSTTTPSFGTVEISSTKVDGTIWRLDQKKEIDLKCNVMFDPVYPTPVMTVEKCHLGTETAINVPFFLIFMDDGRVFLQFIPSANQNEFENCYLRIDGVICHLSLLVLLLGLLVQVLI